MDANRLRRAALRLFLTLIGLNAVIAIAAILGVGDGSDARWQVLATSSVISGASLIVAADAAAVARQVLGRIPIAAAILAVTAAALTVAGIWTESESEGLWETVGVLGTVGVTGTACALLGLPDLRPPWPRAQWTAQAAAVAIGAQVVVSILWEDEGSIRAYGIAAVVFAAATIVVLVGARVAAIDRDQPDDTHLVQCPHCGGTFDPTMTEELGAAR